MGSIMAARFQTAVVTSLGGYRTNTFEVRFRPASVFLTSSRATLFRGLTSFTSYQLKTGLDALLRSAR